ncbi:MAG: hypothetical protein AB9907_17385 [Flexilinea sp.]
MAVQLLDDSLKIEIFIDKEDAEFDDDVCVRVTETCEEEEKIFYAGETNIYLTRDQARQIVEEFQKVLSLPE